MYIKNTVKMSASPMTAFEAKSITCRVIFYP